MTTPALRRLDRREITQRSSEIVDLYSEVYAEPPYNEGPEQRAAYVDRLKRETSSSGFELVVAEVDGEIIGFAYGLELAADQWWPEATEPETALTAGQAKYMVCEFVVRKARRGQGVGRALMARLLADRPEPWATLCSNPAAPARQIYARWGWERVGTAVFAGAPPSDILVRPNTDVTTT